MKNLFNISFVIIALLFSACSDPCDGIACGANGTCDEGTCICDTGYEGVNCEAKINEKFVGNWTSSNWNCDGTISEKTLVIQAGTTTNDLLISDPFGFGSDLNAIVAGNTITISSQTTGTGFLIDGTGTFANNVLTMSFNLDALIEIIVCTGEFTQ